MPDRTESVVQPAERRPAIVLLSGGLDSATVLALAQHAGFTCHCLTFDYGQRHRVELDASARIARTLNAASHRVLPIDLRAIGGSALTSDTPVPKGRTHTQIDAEIPVTYVPARNLVFLSLALALAEVLLARDIFIGVNAVDYSGYPDCRPEFIRSFQHTANLATRVGVERASGEAAFQIHTPLIDLSKAQIIQAGDRLAVPFAHTLSCYDPDPDALACAQCDACLLRKKGFQDAGVPDPTRYRPQ